MYMSMHTCLTLYMSGRNTVTSANASNMAYSLLSVQFTGGVPSLY